MLTRNNEFEDSCLVFSQDRSFFYASGEPFTLHRTSDTLQIINFIPFQVSPYTVGAILMDDKILAAYNENNGTLELWHLEDYELLLEQEVDSRVTNMLYHPTSGLLALENANRSIALWHISETEDGLQFELQRNLTAAVTTSAVLDLPARDMSLCGRHIAFSPDGSLLGAFSEDNRRLVLWDTANGSRLAELAGHNDILTSLAFSPDGTLLATGSADGTVRLWGVP
jgi:WD40 repeat protein